MKVASRGSPLKTDCFDMWTRSNRSSLAICPWASSSILSSEESEFPLRSPGAACRRFVGDLDRQRLGLVSFFIDLDRGWTDRDVARVLGQQYVGDRRALTFLVIAPLMIWIECPWEIAGPASTSNAPKSGASNESSSGVALSENPTRKLSPAVTTIGALALKGNLVGSCCGADEDYET